LIGGGGFFIWHTRTTQEPLGGSQPPVVTTPVASAPAPAPVVASPEIALQTEPADAVVVIDGKELPSDKRAITRPAAGQTMTVVIRAKGYEDTSVLVDYFTPTPLDVTLKPIPLEIDVPDPAATASASSAPAAPAASTAKPKPKLKDPNVLPDNPY
jgi:hypothetical protein